MDKGALLRLACDEQGVWWPDLRQKAPGRGRYLCLRPECMRRFGDRSVRRAFPGERAEALAARVTDALWQRSRELMQRLRGRAFVGRDAVLHALWGAEPLLLLLAKDASQGLAQRVTQAFERHRGEGAASALLSAGQTEELGAVYGRDLLAVVAWPRDVLAERLMRLMGWREVLLAHHAGSRRKTAPELLDKRGDASRLD